jgi:hypothetical protein
LLGTGAPAISDLGDCAACRHRRVGHDSAAPDRGDQVVPADDALAVAHQKDQQIEHLRLDRDPLSPPPQFAAVDIQRMFGEFKPHRRLPDEHMHS